MYLRHFICDNRRIDLANGDPDDEKIR